VARLTQLTGTQLHQLHEDAWNATFSDERDTDWSQLTPLRRREMYLLADGLGLSKLAEKVRAVIEACAEPEPPPESRYLRGSRVGICGNTSDWCSYALVRRHTEPKSRSGLPKRFSGWPRRHRMQ
jgi:DNA polymerase III subunit epsilon